MPAARDVAVFVLLAVIGGGVFWAAGRNRFPSPATVSGPARGHHLAAAAPSVNCTAPSVSPSRPQRPAAAAGADAEGLAVLAAARRVHCRKSAQQRDYRLSFNNPAGLGRLMKTYRRGQSRTTGYFPYLPTYACPDEERVGMPTDGGKWMCGVQRLLGAPCVIYSLGSQGKTDFETDIKGLAPQCEIHTFDPGNYGERVNSSVSTYHQWGIGVASRRKFHNLHDVMRMLGHRNLTVLKIDIESGEYSVIPAAFCPQQGERIGFVGQIQMEVHNSWHAKMPDLFNCLFSQGFHIFHMEINYISVRASEFALIHESLLPRHLRDCPHGPRTWPNLHSVSK